MNLPETISFNYNYAGKMRRIYSSAVSEPCDSCDVLLFRAGWFVIEVLLLLLPLLLPLMMFRLLEDSGILSGSFRNCKSSRERMYK